MGQEKNNAADAHDRAVQAWANVKTAATKVSKTSRKAGGEPVSIGFKKKFSDAERADITIKRREMCARLYAAG